MTGIDRRGFLASSAAAAVGLAAAGRKGQSTDAEQRAGQETLRQRDAIIDVNVYLSR